MTKHLRYAWYVLRHKWFVLIECCRRGMWWRAFTHDLSKFSAAEWFPYAEHFYGQPRAEQRDATGYYKPYDTGDLAFDRAWLHHQHANDHHWQWWILPCDEEGTRVLEMSEGARLEMLCDWIGAGRAQGTLDICAWYEKNRQKMQLHPQTRLWLEQQMRQNGGR